MRLPGREAQMHTILGRDSGGALEAFDMRDLILREAVRLDVGETPEGIAVVRAQFVRSPVTPDRLAQLALRLARVTQHDVHTGLVARSHAPLLVPAYALVEPAQSYQRVPRRQLIDGILRLRLPQDLRLLQGLIELALAIENPQVVGAGADVVRLEFHAALQQEFGVVEDSQPDADLGEQTHCLDVVAVPGEELPAQRLRLVQPAFEQQVRHGDEIGRQARHVFDL